MKKILILLAFIAIYTNIKAQSVCDSFKVYYIGSSVNNYAGTSTANITIPFRVYDANITYLSNQPGYINSYQCKVTLNICRTCDTSYINAQIDTAITAYVLQVFYQKPPGKK